MGDQPSTYRDLPVHGRPHARSMPDPTASLFCTVRGRALCVNAVSRMSACLGVSLCVAELRLRAGVYRPVRTRRAAFADGPLMVIMASRVSPRNVETSPMRRGGVTDTQEVRSGLQESAVRLVRETGKPIAQVARELGIHDRTLGSWVNADRGTVSAVMAG